jgi:hypothetical protein
VTFEDQLASTLFTVGMVAVVVIGWVLIRERVTA